ncbi:hypothetical protein KS18_07745 [Photorhabdus luminescens]|nr:hypothetical protein KS18_07745 [Photorhabdus luminescens]
MMAWLGAGAAQRTHQTKTAAADNAPPPTEGSTSADTVLNYLESEDFQRHSLAAAMTYTVARPSAGRRGGRREAGGADRQ